MQNIIAILLVIFLSQSISFAEDCFPEKAVSYSPSKRYSITWQEPSDGETHHLIFDNGQERKTFFEFVRSVCIHWEPKERYFSLTYNIGSNVSEVYVYKSSGPEKVLNLLDVIPLRVKDLYVKNYHSYIKVLSWTNSGLFARVWGYGDLSPNGYEVNVKCVMDDSVLHCIEEKG